MAVSFGFSNDDSALAGITQLTRANPIDTVHNVGLGSGVGAQLAKSALGSAAYKSLDPIERARQQRMELPSKVLRSHKVTRLVTPREATPRETRISTLDEPQRMFRELLLSDHAWAQQPAAPEDLAIIRDHRWSFRGALDLAERCQGHCFFIRCLLDMQRNVQCEEEGDALDPTLTKACKVFVSGQCSHHKEGQMYQLLTHFISNAVIFEEWDRYLKGAFASEKANQETFLVPHLEQVWFRFCRMLATLEEIFGILDSRFVWRHRLPRVGDIVKQTVKKRCFSSQEVTRNEMFTQEKYMNETVKNLKRCFGLGN